MKFFPESWVPDPDKKISPFDESLINKIIAGVLKSDQEIKFIKNRLDTDIPANDHNQRIISLLKKGEKDFYIGFVKISEYRKENFEWLGHIVHDYCDCMGFDPGGDFSDLDKLEWIKKKTKKLVGIRIIFGPRPTELTSFVVGSQDDSSTYTKLNKYAAKIIPDIINFVINNYINVHFKK